MGVKLTGGVATAAEEALDQLPDREAAVQAFLDLGEEEIGAADAVSPLGLAVQAGRGRGRPKGSKNRRTEAVAAWLLSQARHPVAVMLEAASMSTDDFLRAAGFRHDAGTGDDTWFSNDLRMEALKLQYRLAEVAAPYVAQKLPQAVQVAAEGAVQVTFAGVSLPARGGARAAGDVIEGQAMAVKLPSFGAKSDDTSRTDGEATGLIEDLG